MDKRLTREERFRQIEEASKDPLFLADIEEVERDFAYADAEACMVIDRVVEELRSEEKPA